MAGLFLFLPLLARLGFHKLVQKADYAGSNMVPADAALLSLLTLKLVDKERRSHIDDFNFEEALGLFAGLNVLPKKSFAADYSYRTERQQQEKLLSGWVKQICRCCCRRPAPSLWTFIPFPTAARMPCWRTTTFPVEARPAPACNRFSRKSTKIACFATPTPT